MNCWPQTTPSIDLLTWSSSGTSPSLHDYVIDQVTNGFILKHKGKTFVFENVTSLIAFINGSVQEVKRG